MIDWIIQVEGKSAEVAEVGSMSSMIVGEHGQVEVAFLMGCIVL